MFVEISKQQFEAKSVRLEPISGGELFGGGEFLELGIGGVVRLRVERKGGKERFLFWTGV